MLTLPDPHHQLQLFFNDIIRKLNPRDYFWDYKNNTPIPYIVFDNFLPVELFELVSTDHNNIPDYLWNEFTRNGSYMKECKSLIHAPMLNTLSYCFNSGVFIDWLERLTDQKKLIPDPHLIGAGMSKTVTGNSLKLHTDFNWNDELALNRSLSLIFYTNPTWDESWGGGLEFWNFEKTNIIQSTLPRPNRLLIWNYDHRLIHGYPAPLNCPTDQARINMRIFYYQSNSVPNDQPHRSLYWWDNNSMKPLDNRTQK
jgi:hypothetical protein